MVTRENVIEKLKEVIDPELNVNIVDLGLIYDVKIYSSSKPRRHPRENGDPIKQNNVDSRLPPKGTSSPRRAARGNDNYGDVNIKMILTSPGCPLSSVFEEWIREAVLKLKGVKNVTIDLVWEPIWTPERMSDTARETLGII